MGTHASLEVSFKNFSSLTVFYWLINHNVGVQSGHLSRANSADRALFVSNRDWLNRVSKVSNQL